jgi:N-acyl-L-homoserine lactone synthetase
MALGQQLLDAMQIVTGKLTELSYELECALAQYRYAVFIERLGWQLPATGGMERDQFDHPATLYAIARSIDGRICGCGRLLPTTGPYLLSEVFPHVLGEIPLPRSPDVWELSRFAATGDTPDSSVDVAKNTRALLASIVQLAVQHGARRLVTLSPLGIERLLLRMGVHAHRAAPPVLVDGARVIAIWIELDAQTLSALAPVAEDTHFACPRREDATVLAAQRERLNVAHSIS